MKTAWHLRHRTRAPATGTFSSAMLYVDWQVLQVTFIPDRSLVADGPVALSLSATPR